MADIKNISDYKPRPRKGLGYEPPESNKDWLSPMAQGTRFLAKLKIDSGSKLTEFVVAAKLEDCKYILVGESIGGMGGKFDWRIPELFCQDYDLFMTLDIVDMTNGNSNNLHPRAMVSDGNDPNRDQEPS